MFLYDRAEKFSITKLVPRFKWTICLLLTVYIYICTLIELHYLLMCNQFLICGFFFSKTCQNLISIFSTYISVDILNNTLGVVNLNKDLKGAYSSSSCEFFLLQSRYCGMHLTIK